MTSRTGAVTVLAMGLSLILTPARPAAQATEWAELTRRDLRTIRETILENHPGPVDSLNPGYRSWLDSGYTRALAMADSVRSLDGLVATLTMYASGFQDGHLGWASDFVRRTVRWPGIVLARRQDRYVVSHVADWVKVGPPLAAVVLSCGGMPIDERMTREVMPFEGGILTLEASRARLAPSLLVWDGNPWRTRPTACRVQVGKSERDVTLEWRAIAAEQLAPLQTAAAYGVTPAKFELTRPSAGIAWVTVPSFAENVEDNRAGLEGLVKALPSVRDARLIVFDVRGNHGGNSYWGRQLLAALFGAAYVDSVRAAVEAPQYVQWRASAGNADFVERSTMPRFANGSPERAELAALVAAMRSAMARGEALTPPPNGASQPASQPASRPASPPVAPRPLGRRVLLLTDGWCASACLDFVDLVLGIPGVRHAGAATYADAVYIDNRSVRLPSDLGWFGFSMKVYRGRPRGHNQPYVPPPALRYDGAVWDTPTLQAWVARSLR